jgi:hypothetical protein
MSGVYTPFNSTISNAPFNSTISNAGRRDLYIGGAGGAL